MARQREQRKDLPQRMYWEKARGFYRYRPKGGGPSINLGSDLAEALAKYAKLVAKPSGPLDTMGKIMDRYLIEELPNKAPRTQLDNRRELANLRRTFGEIHPDEITPQYIYQYMDARGAPVRANREISLLSHIYKKAIRWGATTKNPCGRENIEKNKELPRDRLPSDRDLECLKSVASPMIRAYVDFKHITGMRKGDILTLTKSSGRDDGIHYVPRKTRKRDPKTGERKGKERVILWTDDLREVWDRIIAIRSKRRVRVAGKRQPAVETVYLFASINGKPYYSVEKRRSDGFDAIWKRYMKKAKEKAAAEGWTLEHFTEHDIRAKAGTDAEEAGQAGPKLLGNTERQFRATYDRGVEKVTPLTRKKAS